MGRDETLNPFAKASVIDLGTTVLDRLGRPLDPGDEVLVTGIDLSQMLWKVQSIGPVVDPRAPSNTVRIMLMAPVALLVRARESSGNLTRVRTREESGAPEPEPGPPSVEITQERGWRAHMMEGVRRLLGGG